MQSNKDRKISVIMGIYNCEKTLLEAIQSITSQTYNNWEIIMCDDASTDATFEVAKKITAEFKNKIILLHNEKNMGLNYTLNKCLEYATGEFVARMDGDDICHPERFEKELKVFEQNPDIHIVSSNMELFDEKGVFGKTNKAEKPDIIDLLHRTSFCHAPCLVKKEAFDAVGGYTVSKKLLRVEDYHLWLKMFAKGFKGINIQEPLYMMRDDRNAQRRRKLKFRINEAYVKHLIIKEFKLPKKSYLLCLKPIILGVLPNFIYNFLHRNIKK